MAALVSESYQGTIKKGWLDKSVSDPKRTDGTSAPLLMVVRIA